MLFSIRKIIALITAIILSMGVYIPPSKMQPIEAEEHRYLKLQVALMADSQIVANSDRHMAFKGALEDVQNNADKVHGIVLAGDLTESGDAPTNEIVINMLSELSVEKKIIASGNHDVRLFYNRTMSRFINDVNTLGSAAYTVTKPYYYTRINGYYFIVLGSEKQELEGAYISDEQLKFLDDTLAEATVGGYPAFVICHQPLANTHGLPGIWRTGDLGSQSSSVAEIMEKYKNVFFLSGHTHSGFGKYTYDSLKNTKLINIPSVGKGGSREYDPAGTGFMMEVYSDRVVFRSRNFAQGKYLGSEYPSFDRVFYLK